MSSTLTNIVSSVPGLEEEVQLVDITDKKDNDEADLIAEVGFMEEAAAVSNTTSDESEKFKQDVCQGLNSTGEGEEVMKHDEDKNNNQVIFKKKRRRATNICCLPSCNEKALHRCSRCLSVSYCSQECSEQHWAVHREQCRDWEAEVD